jgi:hypothetical protein
MKGGVELLQLDEYFFLHRFRYKTYSDFIDWAVVKGDEIISKNEDFKGLLLVKNKDLSISIVDTVGLFESHLNSNQSFHRPNRRWNNKIQDYFSSILQEINYANRLKEKQRFVDEFINSIVSAYGHSLLEDDFDCIDEIYPFINYGEVFRKETFQSLKESHIRISSLQSSVGRILSKLLSTIDIRQFIRCKVHRSIHYTNQDDDEFSFRYAL